MKKLHVSSDKESEAILPQRSYRMAHHPSSPQEASTGKRTSPRGGFATAPSVGQLLMALVAAYRAVRAQDQPVRCAHVLHLRGDGQLLSTADGRQQNASKTTARWTIFFTF